MGRADYGTAGTLAVPFHFIPAIWSEEKGEEEKGGK